MLKNTHQNIKEAVRKREWVILYGGTRKERLKLASIAHETEIRCKHTGKNKPLEENFKRMDLAGCPENKIYESIVSELWLLRPEEYPREESISNPSSIARTLFFQNLLCDSDDARSEIRKLAGQLGIMKDEISNLCTLVIGTTKKSYDNIPVELKDIFLCIDVDEEVNLPEKTVGNKSKGIKGNLSKLSEYLRLDDNNDVFYAKSGSDTEEVLLDLSSKSQEYKLLRHLYNIYGTMKSKAFGEDLLIVCDIQNHEKGEFVDERKIKHLRKVVSDARTALEKAGLKRGHLKYEYKVDDKNRVVQDECSLLIYCSPK